MTESPLVDSSFNVPVFSPGDDPIACLNKAMAFLTVVASLSSTSLAEGTRSNFSGMVTKSNATSFGRNNASGYARVVKCYNCQGEGHMARQCTQPRRTRNVAWYKDKAMLAEAQEAGQMLDEEQLAFLTKDLDTYDSDCDDISNAKAVLMANISNYGSDVISKAQQDSMILSVIEQMSNPTSKSSDASPIKIEAPKELPKVSLVNESLKKLKFYLARFDNVVKIKTTPDARTEGCPDCSLVSGLWMFETYNREPLSAHELFQEAAAPRAAVLSDSPMSTSIDQDAPSTSIPSTQEQEHSPTIS
ncbi:retrovirus-related pol polyprotein from transposon TNT 1-94 [Tanacetum coccineum]